MSSTSRFHVVNGQRVLKPSPYKVRGVRTVGRHSTVDRGDTTAPCLFLPPGIGDIHWVMMKLRSFTEKHLGGRKPDVWLMDAGTRNRASDYLDRVPLLRYRGTYNPPWGGHLHTEMLYNSGIVQGAEGFDWVLCANPHLEKNGDFATWLPDCDIEWDYPLEERNGDAELAEKVLADGPYVLASFFREHWYASHFLAHFSVAEIAASLKQIARRCRVLLTGAWWDTPFLTEIAAASGASMEIVGQTTCPQLLSLLRRCRGYIGHPAGNGIMAAHFRRPTVLLWSSSWFKVPLFTSWVRPEDRGDPYRAVDLVGGKAAVDAALESWPP